MPPTPAPTFSVPAQVKDLEKYFILDKDRLVRIVDEFKAELHEGLTKYGCDVAMVPSFVPSVPDGTEVG
jgi:hexokinase